MGARPGRIRAAPGALFETALGEVDQARHIRWRGEKQGRKGPLGREPTDGAGHGLGQSGRPAHQGFHMGIGAGAAPIIIGVKGIGGEDENHPRAGAGRGGLHADKVVGAGPVPAREQNVVIT